MVHIVKRMRKLRELLWIRVGPGALILPKEVSKISMEFRTKMAGGHRGAKKFWREMLPRIKYRNPTIPVEITRHTDPEGPSLLHIYTKASAGIAQAQAQDTPPSGSLESAAPAFTFDIKNKEESEILNLLVEKLNATPVQPTQQELDEIEEMEEFNARAEKDRQDVREKLLEQRKEQEMLRLARGDVAQVK